MTSHTFTSASHPGGAMSTTLDFAEQMRAATRPRAEALIEGRPERPDVKTAVDKRAWMVAEGLSQFYVQCRSVEHYREGVARLKALTDGQVLDLLKGTRFGRNGWYSEWATHATARKARVQLLAELAGVATEMGFSL